MIIDKQTLFSDEQAITASAASTNIYDTGAVADVGPGNTLKLLFGIDETFTVSTGISVTLQTDSEPTFATPANLWVATTALAGLTRGARVSLPSVPAGCERYLRLSYGVIGSSATSGKVTAGIILDNQQNVSTAD